MDQYEMKLYSSSEDVPDLRNFIIKYHYLKSIARGCKYVFVLLKQNEIMGVAQFGEPVGFLVKKKYGEGTIELKRFVLHPGCKKNTGSWFMAKCMKVMKYKANRVISYSDPEYGHTGTLYKACNFIHVGKQQFPTQYIKYKGKKYSTRIVNAARPSKIGQMLKKAWEKGLAKNYTAKKKDIFIYELQKR